MVGEINEERYREVCERLGLLSPPRVRFTPAASDCIVKGEIDRNAITIYLGNLSQHVERLPRVNRDIAFTLLHELRHAYQYMTWSTAKWNSDQLRPYPNRECERDANQWAEDHLAEFSNVVRVKRHHFTRLPG